MAKLNSQKVNYYFINNFSFINEEKDEEGENLTFMNSKILFRK